MFADSQSPDAFAPLGTASSDRQGDNKYGGQMNFPANRGARDRGAGLEEEIQRNKQTEHTPCAKPCDRDQDVLSCKAEPGTP